MSVRNTNNLHSTFINTYIKPYNYIFNHCETGKTDEMVAKLRASIPSSQSERPSNSRPLLHRIAKIRNINGETLLITASKVGNVSAVRFLLQHSNMNARDASGKTALIHAAISGNREVCELLVQNLANANLFDDFGNTALTYAEQCGHNEIIYLLKDTLFKKTGEQAFSSGDISIGFHNKGETQQSEYLEYSTKLIYEAGDYLRQIAESARAGIPDNIAKLIAQNAYRQIHKFFSYNRNVLARRHGTEDSEKFGYDRTVGYEDIEHTNLVEKYNPSREVVLSHFYKLYRGLKKTNTDIQRIGVEKGYSEVHLVKKADIEIYNQSSGKLMHQHLPKKVMQKIIGDKLGTKEAQEFFKSEKFKLALEKPEVQEQFFTNDILFNVTDLYKESSINFTDTVIKKIFTNSSPFSIGAIAVNFDATKGSIDQMISIPVVFHASSWTIPSHNKLISKLFQKALFAKTYPEMIDALAELRFTRAFVMPCARGSAAISEYLECAILVAKGYGIPKYKDKKNLDFLAFETHDLEAFKKEYPHYLMFESSKQESIRESKKHFNGKRYRKL